MSGGVSDVVIEDLVGTGEMGIDVKSGKGRGGYIRNVTFRRFRQVFGHTRCTAAYCGDIAPRSYGDGSEGAASTMKRRTVCVDIVEDSVSIRGLRTSDGGGVRGRIGLRPPRLMRPG